MFTVIGRSVMSYLQFWDPVTIPVWMELVFDKQLPLWTLHSLSKHITTNWPQLVLEQQYFTAINFYQNIVSTCGKSNKSLLLIK